MSGRIETADEDAATDAGGPAAHVPVLLREVVDILGPADDRLYIDATFGAGGYSRALLAAGASVMAIDRDPDAVRAGATDVAASAGRLTLDLSEFSRMEAVAASHGAAQVDGVVLDVGVSSMQLDTAERGFSFLRDGPLDMRMGRSGPSAADVVNGASAAQLTRIFGILGEERAASRIARALVERRERGPITRTIELADAILAANPAAAAERIHPATRVFQALRIFVNRELEELAQALFSAERLLRAGGRLAVVTFHSLEDRLVKRFFASRTGGLGEGSRHLPLAERPLQTFVCPKRAGVTPTAAEVDANPRARSARLRWGERTASPPGPVDLDLFGLADLALGRTGERAGAFRHA